MAEQKSVADKRFSETKKVLRHPDKEEIIERLSSGESVKSVEAWIRKKYENKPNYHISYLTLQKFRTDNLNLKGSVLEDIKTKREQSEGQALKEEFVAIVANSDAYQKKLDEIVGANIDVSRRLLEMEKLISARIEVYFNAIQSGKSLNNFNDKMFIEYIKTLREIMQDWKKFVEGVADKKVEHNVSVKVVDTQSPVIKQAILDTLKEMDPQMTLIFIDKLTKRLASINYDSPEYNNYIIDAEVP